MNPSNVHGNYSRLFVFYYSTLVILTNLLDTNIFNAKRINN